MKGSSLKTEIWISGSPRPYILCYFDSAEKVVPVELQSFRPDPQNFLRKNRTYPAKLIFETEVETVQFLRRIIVWIKKKPHTFYRI